jgi:membrane fusion protein, multidrug efflux system
MDDTTSNGSRKTSGLFFLGGVLVVLVVVGMLSLLMWRHKTHLETTREAGKQAVAEGPLVRVATATRAPEVKQVELVGEARPFTTTTLYAKVSGYLHEIKVDKGDAVKIGELLAVISSPEIDRQHESAVADAKNRRLEAKRAWRLLPQSGTSQQDAEAKEAAAQMAEANALAMETMKGYQILRAPFGGVVTARFVDPGALIQSATSAQTTTQPIVTLAETDRLRVYVYLDQKHSALVRIADPARVFDAARPEVSLTAQVTRTSIELDAKTRTLLTEIDVDNRSGKLIPGSFVKVALHLKMPPAVQAPCEALVVREEKTCVGILTEDLKVSYREVGVLDSDGKMMTICSGLLEGEKVLLNPGIGLSDGDKVQPVDVAAKR